MGRVLARLAVAVGLVGFASGCATPPLTVGSIPAAPFAFTAPAAPLTPPTATVIPTSSVAAVIPSGFISFCIRFPDQCTKPKNAPSTIALTASTWRTLVQVNMAVNEAIWPETDEKHYGREDYWTIPTDGYGDCEDYALTKRKELIDAGLPEPALRMAVVVTPDEERHAVLTVATDKGDFVLDNLRNNIVAWNATGYTWIERQDPTRAMAWLSVQTPAGMIAANDTATQPVSSIGIVTTASLPQPASSTSIK